MPRRLVDESQSQHDVTDGGEFLRIKCDVLGYWNPAAADQLRVLHSEYCLQLAIHGMSVFGAFSGDRAQSSRSSPALRLRTAWNSDRHPPVLVAHVLQFPRGAVREHDVAVSIPNTICLSLALCETKCFVFSIEDRVCPAYATCNPGSKSFHDSKAHGTRQFRW